MWRQVVWYTGKNILEGSAASIFRIEDGYSRFLQNVAPFYCTKWCQIPKNWKRESIIAVMQFITATNVNTVKTSTVKYCMYKLQGHIQPCTLQYTYLLTPCSRVLLEKLTGSAASQEIPRIFGTRRFIPYSQVLATCPCPEPTPFSPHDSLPIPEDPS